MNDDLLALYLGYAFSHAVNIQHVLEPEALMVPYVIYWRGEQATPVPYPAQTQEEAVEKARAARAKTSTDVTGWSSGREGLVAQNDGAKIDVLLIEGWVTGLEASLDMFVYYRKHPFRLVHGFVWANHSQARKDGRAFMVEFKRGILKQPFGERCLEYVERAEVF